MAELAPVSYTERPSFILIQGGRDQKSTQLELPVDLPPLRNSHLSQLHLNMSIPDSFSDPVPYHRQYDSVDGSTFYDSELRRDPVTSDEIETGYGSIIIAGDIGGKTTGASGTGHIGYIHSEAAYVSATFLDRQKLANHYAAVAERSTSRAPGVQASYEFSGPFFDSYQPPLPSFPYAGVRREGEELVVERRVVTQGQEEVDMFRAPFRIDGLPKMLRDEGKRQVARDNEAEVMDMAAETGEEQIVFEVPKRYPASFSSVTYERTP